MKVIIIALSAVLAVASAGSIAYLSPAGTELRSSNILYAAGPIALAAPTQQQYHAQDAFGQYSYGYSDPLSAKQEVRSLDGVTRGSYSYRDAEGKLQTVDYTADEGGFRVSATNLPRAVPIPEVRPVETPSPVSDTVEVVAARAAHLAAHQESSSRSDNQSEEASSDENATSGEQSAASPSASSSSSSSEARSSEQSAAPKPVEDTPEVAAAKAEHLQRLEQEKLRNIALSQRNSQIAYQVKSTPLIQTIYPTVYSYSYPLRHSYVPAVANSRFLASNVIY